MSTLAAPLLFSVAVLILAAVVAGTLAARFFVAASRTHERAPEQEI